MYLEFTLIILITGFIVSLFLYDENVLSGFISIISYKSLLLTDYITVGGISATLLNVILILCLNLSLIKFCDLKINGGVFAGIYIMIGFSFFGKNILNILPIYFGIWLYSKTQHHKFKRYFIIALFASGMAPIVSFGFLENNFLTILGIILGIGYGFIVPALSAQLIRYHSGYTLYNIGFTGGIVAIVVFAVLNLFGIETEITSSFSKEYHYFLLTLFMIIVLMYLIVGITMCSERSRYKKMLSMSGRAVTDFTMIFDKSLTYINFGILGLIACIVLLLSDDAINGIVFGVAITVVGFSGFGKHARNVLPLIISILIIGYLHVGTINNEIVIIALFSTGLAPISGDFGVIAGLIAGLLHYSLVIKTANWQGGLNLYNNGFVTGIVAGFLGGILDSIELKRR